MRLDALGCEHLVVERELVEVGRRCRRRLPNTSTPVGVLDDLGGETSTTVTDRRRCRLHRARAGPVLRRDDVVIVAVAGTPAFERAIVVTFGLRSHTWLPLPAFMTVIWKPLTIICAPCAVERALDPALRA